MLTEVYNLAACCAEFGRLTCKSAHTHLFASPCLAFGIYPHPSHFPCPYGEGYGLSHLSPSPSGSWPHPLPPSETEPLTVANLIPLPHSKDSREGNCHLSFQNTAVRPGPVAQLRSASPRSTQSLPSCRPSGPSCTD